MKVRVHIERLVIEGMEMARPEGERLGRDLESALARELRAGGLARSLTKVGGGGRSREGPPEDGLVGHAEPLGARLARRICDGLRGPR